MGNPDKKLFKLLEAKLKQGKGLHCTFYVDNSWWYDYVITYVSNCHTTTESKQ